MLHQARHRPDHTTLVFLPTTGRCTDRALGLPMLAGAVLAAAVSLPIPAAAASEVVILGRTALLGAQNFAGGAGTALAQVPGDALGSSDLLPLSLSLVGSGSNTAQSPPFTSQLDAQWNITQSFAAAGSVLSAEGQMDVSSAGTGCSIGSPSCFGFNGGGVHNNRLALTFTVSELTPYTASGVSGSQQLITVNVWNGTEWVNYFGAEGGWDRVATYNPGLAGAAPINWSISNVFQPGLYRIFNADDFYVGNASIVWSYSIEFSGAEVRLVPEPGAALMLVAGLGVVYLRWRGQARAAA
jgi:hypothetical protein